MKLLKTLKIQHTKGKKKNIEKKTSDATTLIRINQYKTDKQNLEKNIEMLIKNTI